MSDRLCLPLAAWPDHDRRLWLAATAPVTTRRFALGPQLPTMAPATRRKVEGGYARWLGFLAGRGRLNAETLPAARVTQEAVADWLDDLKAHGNADHTIVGRLAELQSALRLLAPGIPFDWLSRPGGVPIRSRLPMRRRSLVVHHPRTMFDWGLALVERAKSVSGDDRRRVMLRDGVMIMLLAARAPRLRSLAVLRLGVNVRREPEGWRIDFGEGDIKTGRPLAYGLPLALQVALDRYVAVERTELLGGRVEDALWIGWDGTAMQPRGIEKRIRWWSAKRFGPDQAFGPHRFRYGIATVGPIADPETPTIGASVLGITAGTMRNAYDRGGRAAAAKRYHAGHAQERARTAAVARNIFARRADRIIRDTGDDVDGV